ncbi:hypothetical protein C7M84_004255 [Penaeus vannamei]|uniref:FAS1 domain-containing protein n=1 Tax=Penaeus vannamei TaxID=6689 RepID=A0A423TKX3_PENVA|nr:hypothetical protein C7M84_004255 [Penaeus vannamei]
MPVVVKVVPAVSPAFRQLPAGGRRVSSDVSSGASTHSRTRTERGLPSAEEAGSVSDSRFQPLFVRLIIAMGFLRPSVAVAVLAGRGGAQLPFSAIPTISDELRAKALSTRATRFLRLWEYALKVDGQGPGPAIRVNFEAKTILAPGPLAYFNLIPQDASDPLYGKSKPLQALRRTFLLDHLVLDPIEPSDPKLEEGDGVRALTFTGKDLYFKKDKEGNITVGGVAVQDVTSLHDGTQVYILADILFDNRAKVRTAFNQRQAIAEELRKPLGPPLDIPDTPSSFPTILRSPAPPPPGLVGPPAIPTLSEDPLVRPPAPPPSFSAAAPPATPTFVVDPAVLPPAALPQTSPGPRPSFRRRRAPRPSPLPSAVPAPGAPPPPPRLPQQRPQQPSRPPTTPSSSRLSRRPSLFPLHLSPPCLLASAPSGNFPHHLFCRQRVGSGFGGKGKRVRLLTSPIMDVYIRYRGLPPGCHWRSGK